MLRFIRTISHLKPPTPSASSVEKKFSPGGDLKPLEDPADETPELPKKHVFQEIRRKQNTEDVYTLEQAAQEATMPGTIHTYYRYPLLTNQHSDSEYAIRAVENEYTHIKHFPEITDCIVVGSGLVGSATAYYLKKICSRSCDILVLDKDPNSTTNCTAVCNGLISSQSKSQDISRLACISKELIRGLKNDLVVTAEDFAKIKYRPCTHLILWPQKEVDEVLAAVTVQISDGCYTEAKLAPELESSFPWLKAVDTDIALGTHGNQDEALVDPLALRNLYRCLAQAYGANFVKAEAIDFNTCYSYQALRQITRMSTAGVVARIPHTKELRNIFFAKTLLCLGHNTPYLEERAELDPSIRDGIEDLHFLQPKLRISFSFHSLAAPVINFPVITDTDGSMLVRDDYYGDFKYYLTYEESEPFLDDHQEMFMDLDSEEPYVNLTNKSTLLKDYFYNVIKPRLVKRIPSMEDAEFNLAHSGFENYNAHDGNPIISPHPFLAKLLVTGGYGSRMMSLGPAAAAALTELMLYDEERLLDVTKFYWNRVLRNRRVSEFTSLLQ